MDSPDSSPDTAGKQEPNLPSVRRRRRTGIALVALGAVLLIPGSALLYDSLQSPAPPPAAGQARPGETTPPEQAGQSVLSVGVVLLGSGLWLFFRKPRVPRPTAQPDRTTVSTPSAFTSGPLGTLGDPVCPKCRNIYNRAAVVRQLKQQSPEMFDYAGWTTKFKCVECGTVILISGRGPE